MKKTISMLLAIIIAALAICAMAVTVFADNDNDDPVDPLAKVSTTAATVTTTAIVTTTTAPTTTSAPTTTKPTDILAVSSTKRVSNEIISNAPGQTAVDDGPATTSKKASNIDTSNPGTGSNVVVPAVAFLALATGIVAVVKTKKEN